jgi:hypothetical protein
MSSSSTYEPPDLENLSVPLVASQTKEAAQWAAVETPPEQGDQNKTSSENQDVVPTASMVTQESTAQWTRGETQTPQYRDLPFAIAFVVQFSIVTLMALFPVAKDDTNQYNSGNSRMLLSSSAFYFLVAIGLPVLAAPALSLLAFKWMMNQPEGLIKAALLSGILSNLYMGFLFAVIGFPFYFFNFIAVAILGCYARTVWNRIPFAAANLRCAVTAIQSNLGITVLALFSSFVSLVWIFIFYNAYAGVKDADFMKASSGSTNYNTSSSDQGDLSAIGTLVMLLLGLSFYWTLQVLHNTVRATNAGVIGTFWFAPIEASSFCSNAIKDSLSRSLTYSFGSICFGSLIVAILKVLRDILRRARHNRNVSGVVRLCAECILDFIERMVRYFNKWAFIYVGLYGYSYLDAGKNVMELFRARGYGPIITDGLVNRLLSIMGFSIGITIGLAALVIGNLHGVDDSNAGLAVITAFMIGMLFSWTMMSTVMGAVETIVVCMAEAPAEGKANHPQLYNQLESSYTNVYPDIPFGVVVIPM